MKEKNNPFGQIIIILSKQPSDANTVIEPECGVESIAFILKDMAMRSESYKSLELDASESSCASKSKTPRALLNLSSVLERTIQKNEKHLRSTKKKDPITIFHGIKAPNLSVRQYIERIFKYSRCSPCCFVTAQIYMDRYFQRTGGYLTSFNLHRLLITSVMVAAKFVDDGCYSNGYYAKVGGVGTAEMNRMELEFLFNLDFRLFVTTEVFWKYCEQLDKAVVEEYHIQHPTNQRKSNKWSR